MDIELNDSKSKSNDRSYCMKIENLSNDTPSKFDVEHENKFQKDGQTQLNSSQMETYGKTGEIERINLDNKQVESQSFQLNKITTLDLTQSNSSASHSDNLSNDTPSKINVENQNKCQKDGQIQLNSSQMETNGKINEINPENKYVEPHPFQSNETTTTDLRYHSNSSSSSSEDVFQTRYSIFEKNDYKATGNIIDYSVNLLDNNSDVEYTSKNIPKMKTTPIIEAQAYTENKDPIKQLSINNKMLSQIKEQTETSLLKETKSKTELRDAFREDEENLNTNIKSNFAQISEDSLSADLNFSDNISNQNSYKKCIKEMMVDVTPKQCLVSKNVENSKVIEENIIIEKFFNGTFDDSTFQLVSSETTECSKRYENNKLKSVMQTKEGKSNHKINELLTANKRIKHEIIESKNKTGEGSKKHNKKSSKKELNEDKNLNSYQMLNIFSNKIPQQKKTKENSFNINLLGLTDGARENRHMQLKNCQMEYEDNNKYETEEDSAQNKYSRRKVRSSSQVASKKIKEIKKIENLLDPYEIINDKETETEINCSLLNTHKDHNYKETLYNLRQNSNTFKPKITRRNRSKEKHENKKSKMLMQKEYVFDEITSTDDETEINIYDDLLNTHKEYNYKETLYNLRGNSNTFKPKITSTNTKNEQHKNKKSKRSMQHENRFTTIKEREDIEQHSEINQIKHTDNKQISRPIIHSQKSPYSSKIPVKQNTSIDNKKSKAASLNSFYRYMANDDHNLPKDYQAFEKRSKTSIDSENSDLIHHSSAFFTGENSHTEDANNLTVSKEYTKESQPRTWEMFEKEQLKDLNNKQPLNNVCKTVVLKKHKTVMKKDRNLFNVSSTSMLHTISKSKTGNNYNLKYQIRNTKSKFIDSKIDPTYNANSTITVQEMDTRYSNFKNCAIVNKTSTAMEKRSTKFIAPEVKHCNADHKVNNWHLENLSDILDTPQETHLHSQMRFKAHDDKKGYSNKIVSFTKKRKSFFGPKDNLCKAISNFTGAQRNKKGSQRALSTEYPYKSNKNTIEYLQSHTKYDKTLALVPKGEDKNNPWYNLMEKLYLGEEYQGSNEETGINNCDLKDINNESMEITKTYAENSNNLERNETLLIQTDCEVKKRKVGEETLTDQHILADGESDTVKSKIHKPETQNISLVENLNSRNISNQSKTEKMKNAQRNNDICLKLELQKINNRKKIPEEQLLDIESKKDKMKSPSLNFKLNKHVASKLKMHTGCSSSNTPQSKEAKLHEKKSSKYDTSVTNKSREQYKAYLKKLFHCRNSAIHEDDETKSAEENTASNNIILKEPLGKSLKSLNKTKVSLIARQEDDIFSITSSDESSDTSEE